MFVSKTQFICRKFQNLIKILQFFCQDGSFTGMCVTVHKTQNWDKIPEQVLHFLVVLLILFIYFAYLSVCLYSINSPNWKGHAYWRGFSIGRTNFY